MKKLISPGVVQIPSNFPRTLFGPDSRGIRICMKELGRSCLLGQGFITFTDGSAYSYDAPSLDEVVSLCDSFIRGKDFNFRVRRSAGGYVRGFTPPADYEVVYSYPPYPGTVPAACVIPSVDWSQLFWVIVSEVPCGGTVWAWDQVNSNADAQGLHISNGTFTCHQSWETSASLNYIGPLQNAKLTLSGGSIHSIFAWSVAINVTVNGVNVLSVTPAGPPGLTQDYFFTVPDTAGATWAVVVDLVINTHVGFSDTSFNMTWTLADV